MAESEPRRQWSFDSSDFDFSYQLLKGYSVNATGHTLHLNPGLLHKLKTSRPEVLMVAGSWTSPTVLLAGLSRHPRRKIFWSESHLGSLTHSGWFTRRARTFVLSGFREFAVPGEQARAYVERFAKPQRIHPLPNLVDPQLFTKASPDVAMQQRAAMAIPTGKRVLLIAARLAPEKGILQFLTALKLVSSEHREQLMILIAGEGPQGHEIERNISNHPACDIRLLGFRSQSEVAKLYAIADGFCLPSLSDPNPIAVVEALWSGLPLLLSARVGNHIEALVEGENGFVFDPLQPKDIADTVSRWLALSVGQLRMFNASSCRIAGAAFNPDAVINSFLNSALPTPHHAT